MRVLLVASGSRGDMQPLMALALALKARGHTATLAGLPDYESEAAYFGVDFRAYGRSLQSILVQNKDRVNVGPVSMVRILRQEMHKQQQAQFEAVKEAAQGADLVLAAGMAFATGSVADGLKIPYRFVVHTPDMVPSQFHAPVLCPARRLPRLVNRAAWRAFGGITNWLLRDLINAQRAEFGLSAIPDVNGYLFRSDRVILAADPELVRWPSDLAGALPPTGPWLLPDKRELGAKLEAFLNDGEPPVYIGFGSMVDADPDRTTAIIADAVGRVGCRAVLGAGWAKLGRTDHGPRIFTTDDIPHAALFRRVGAVVHHGGAGTAHAAMNAGVPQVIIPHAVDQFGWANRVYEHGLSPQPFKRSALDASNLAASIGACLADEGMRARAASLRDIASSRDGTGTAIAYLERLVHGSRPSARPPSPSRAPRVHAIAA